MPRLSQSRNLATGFLRSSELYPGRIALEVPGNVVTYANLRTEALRMAGLLRQGPRDSHGLTAILASRSVPAFSGTLAALLAGGGYVPLNPAFPLERTRSMFLRSRAQALIADAASEDQLAALLDNEKCLLVVLPERNDLAEYTRNWPQHRFVGSAEIEAQPPVPYDQEFVADDTIAYLLFTSGSTGVPKGVKVSHRNVNSFVDAAVERYGISETDRLSQTFEHTFDLSAFDMFVGWERGACICCPSAKTLLNPASFIRSSKLTVWFSVPSLVLMMNRLGSLKPGAFPELRWSLFCGEPLPADIAAAWSLAAPNSSVENLYGPTEATIAATVYRWDPELSPAESTSGIVPIGSPFPGMTAIVADESLREKETGEGELLLSGPQVSLGYWEDEEKTRASFVIPPGKDKVFYRTGDRVRRDSKEKPLIFLGRLDHQIKIQGYRVELGEVEACIRKEAGVSMAVALGWPLTPSGAAGIEAFIAESSLATEHLQRKLKAVLPGYALPRKIHCIERWPLSSNGKIDRKQLLKYLEGIYERSGGRHSFADS